MLEAHFSKYTPLLEQLSIAYNRLTHTDSLFVDISPMKQLRILRAQFQDGNFVDNGEYRGPESIGSEHVTSTDKANLTDEPFLDLVLPPKLECVYIEATLNTNIYYFPSCTVLRKNALRYFNVTSDKLQIN